MAMISSRADASANRTAYHLVRRAQASIASYRHFDQGDLSKYWERDSFVTMAERITAHFFLRSSDLAILDLVRDLYLALLIMAPILQRLPLSAKFDWHRGHVISFFRFHVNGKIKRYHFGARSLDRNYQPNVFMANLEHIGIHDASMVEMLLDLYRRHAGGTALKDLLARQLFDPILLATQKRGYELRLGNTLYRLEKAPFPGSVDLRYQSANVLDFQVQSVGHQGGQHLEIMLSDRCLSDFRGNVKNILDLAADPAFKCRKIEACIRDLIEQIRPARSSMPQLHDLKHWLATNLRKLAGTSPDVKTLPDLLVNLWLQRCDSDLHLKAPTFFFNPKSHNENTFIKFFSPYREV